MCMLVSGRVFVRVGEVYNVNRDFNFCESKRQRYNMLFMGDTVLI